MPRYCKDDYLSQRMSGCPSPFYLGGARETIRDLYAECEALHALLQAQPSTDGPFKPGDTHHIQHGSPRVYKTHVCAIVEGQVVYRYYLRKQFWQWEVRSIESYTYLVDQQRKKKHKETQCKQDSKT